MKSIIIKNADVIVTMDDRRTVIRDGSIYIEKNKIISIGESKDVDYSADVEIDGRNKIVLPGLINTHHHLYQTMFRNIPAVQNAHLFTWLTELYEIWREITRDAIYISAMTGIIELLLSGCTTTSDHLYIFPPEDRGIVDEEMRAAKELGIRFHPCRGSMSMGKSKGGLPPDDIVQDENEILNFYRKIIERYHDRGKFSMNRVVLGPCSPFSVSDELLIEARELARKKGVFCHTHLAETKDEERFCMENKKMRPFEYMKSVGWLGRDVWFAHCIYLNDKEIKKMAETGTGVSHCPTSNMRLGAGVAPIYQMIENGVNISIGTDGSASNDSSNLLYEVRMAMLLQRAKYGVDKLSATQALELGTVGGARVLGRDEIGSIEPGKAADIILINLKQIGFAGALHDPVTAVVFCHSYGVDYSIINGNLVVKNGKVVGVNMDDIIEMQNEISEEIIKRAERKTGKSFTRKEWKRVY